MVRGTQTIHSAGPGNGRDNGHRVQQATICVTEFDALLDSELFTSDQSEI